jgi:hypothetical protein
VFAEGKGVAWDKAQSYNAEPHIKTRSFLQCVHLTDVTANAPPFF